MALLKFKRSAVPAKVPSIADLALGELAINTYDGKVYTKKDDGTQSIVQVGGGGGGVQTITSSDGSVTVTGTTDINLSVPVTAATQTVILPVRNNTGATLAKGTAVYINGALGQNPTVTKAIATGDATSAQTLGLVTANIANNSVGNVTLIGSLTNIDTSAFSDGQQLYLSPTTAGALTATKPYAPNHLVYMAVVEHAHPSLGKLFVKVQNGYEMDELHNVAAQSPANNDGLFYNTSTSLWEKKSIVTALGYTPYNATNPSGYITGSGSITGSAGSLTGFTNSNSANPISGPDNLTNNGLAYVTGMSLLGQTDGALYTQAYSTSWVHQIYGDYRTGQIALRGKNSGAWQPWRIALDSGNYTNYAMPSGSSATNSVDIRAPIFYDTPNTAYFLDPSNTSNFVGLTVANTITGSVSGTSGSISGFNNPTTAPTANTIVYRDAAGDISAREIVLSSGLSAQTPTVLVSMYPTTNQMVRTTPAAVAASMGALTTGNYTSYAMPSGSSATNSVDVRAPIFYDSPNTAYYVDPAGTSVMWETKSYYLTNIAAVSDNHQFGVYFDGAKSTDYAIYREGGAWSHPYPDLRIAFHTGIKIGAAAGYNGVRFYDNSDMVTQVMSVNNGSDPLGTGNVYVNNSLQAGSSVRAPVFYDTPNTGYYLDPASGSYLSSATFTDLITGRSSPSTDVNSANDTGSISIRGSSTTVASMSFHRAGAYAMNVGLGTDNVFRMGGWSMSSNAFQMDGSGNLTMLGNVTAYSDARLKKDVVTVTNALDLVGKMRGVTYTRKDTGEAGVGVIAQEMLEVLPQVVQQGIGDDDTLSVAYGNIVGVLIEAIKELENKVKALEAKE